jgi:hypothetical protein
MKFKTQNSKLKTQNLIGCNLSNNLNIYQSFAH